MSTDFARQNVHARAHYNVNNHVIISNLCYLVSVIYGEISVVRWYYSLLRQKEGSKVTENVVLQYIWCQPHQNVFRPESYPVAGDRMRNKSLLLLTLLLLLLVSVVELVHCQQTIPYVSFMSQTLADHSYVDISQVGSVGSGSDSVQCRTDLRTCCSRDQGPHRGDWYFPNGDRLPFPDGSDIVESRQPKRVDLRSNNTNEPTGIYHCYIETKAVHDNDMRETLYVGLYTSDGM